MCWLCDRFLYNAKYILHSLENQGGMQIHRISYGVRGFVQLADYAIRWTRMVTDKAKRKARILAFWQKHGLQAAIDAFGISRRTLYLWKSQQKKGGEVVRSKR